MHDSNVIFVRHGQACFGTDDYDRLCENGTQQMQWLGEFLAQAQLPLQKIICGTAKRHQQSAQILADSLGLDGYRSDARWNEFRFDQVIRDFHNGTFPQHDDSREGFWRVVRGAFEAWACGDIPNAYALYSSVCRDYYTALEQLRGQRALVVTSSGVLGALRQHLDQADPRRFADFMNMSFNSALSQVSWSQGAALFESFNAIPHLMLPERKASISLV